MHSAQQRNSTVSARARQHDASVVVTTVQSTKHHIMDTELTAEAVLPEFKSQFARSMARGEEGGGQELVIAGTEDRQAGRSSSQSRRVSDNSGSVGNIVFRQTSDSKDSLALARESSGGCL